VGELHGDERTATGCCLYRPGPHRLDGNFDGEATADGVECCVDRADETAAHASPADGPGRAVADVDLDLIGVGQGQHAENVDLRVGSRTGRSRRRRYRLSRQRGRRGGGRHGGGRDGGGRGSVRAQHRRLAIGAIARGARHPAHEVDGDRDVAVACGDTARLERTIAADVVHGVQLEEEPIPVLGEGDPAHPGELAQLQLEIVEVHSAFISLAA
jgi:hypothetical protein